MSKVAPAPISARPAVTAGITRGLTRLLLALGYAPVTEVPLPNGRRADVAAIGGAGEIVIAEVKSCAADFAADAKWPDYRPYCDRFFFAVDADFPHGLVPLEAGLMVADAFGGAIVREPAPHPLAPARRRAMIIAIARLAALRSAP